MALPMVLAALCLGSLIIVPSLGYTYAGLTKIRISEKQLLHQAAAASAVEYTIWQLKHNVYGLTDQLDPENPSVNTSITVNGVDIPITTEITQSPLGDTWPFPVPTSEQGIHLKTALVIQSPVLLEDGTAHFAHVVYMFNNGTSTMHMKAVYQQLDPRFTYVPDSYQGPNADLTETYVNDHWELHYDFTEPLPTLQAQDATFISFVASTSEEIGDNTYTGSGWVSYAAFGSEEEEFFDSDYSPGTIGCYYDITAESGSYTIRINFGITEEGEIIIRSYLFQ